MQPDEVWLEESLWDPRVRKACPKTGSGPGRNQDWPRIICPYPREAKAVWALNPRCQSCWFRWERAFQAVSGFLWSHSAEHPGCYPRSARHMGPRNIGPNASTEIHTQHEAVSSGCGEPEHHECTLESFCQPGCLTKANQSKTAALQRQHQRDERSGYNVLMSDAQIQGNASLTKYEIPASDSALSEYYLLLSQWD